MEFIHLIREKQAELIRLYHLELKQKDMGVLVFRKDKTQNAQVIYYPLESIKSTYITQRLRAMVMDMEGNTELRLENRLIITLPQFEEMPEGVETPQIMYFCIMDGPSGRLFQLIPQTTEVDGKIWYYYQMIADPSPDEIGKHKEKDTVKDSWTVGPTENGKWFKQACLLSVTNEVFFKTFRSSREFREIIGNEDEEYGKKIVAELDLDELGDIRNYKYLDEIGGPLTYYYSEMMCEMSPTTLRYMNTMLDIGAEELEGKRIIELGGGYGGLCAVITQAIDYASYTVVEVEPVRGLAERYLREATSDSLTEKNIKLIVPEAVEGTDEEWDLLISEYAFCELNEEGIEFYLQTVFPRVKNCYLGMNVWEEVRKNEILTRLQELFTTVTEHKVTPEHPDWKRYVFVCKK